MQVALPVLCCAIGYTLVRARAGSRCMPPSPWPRCPCWWSR
ncbi:hypothetical protein NKH18_37025 [Streptomyces sp. M10(2022)]